MTLSEDLPLVTPEWLSAKQSRRRSAQLMNHDGSTAETIPTEYTRFVAEMLGVELTRPQYVMCRVAFDGVDPIDLDSDEDREIAMVIFGECDRISKLARDVVAAIMGARAGKTYLFALRVLHIGLTCSLDVLAPGEFASGMIVAPDKSLAVHGLRYISGAVRENKALSAMVVADNVESLTMTRLDGETISFDCRAASRGGRAQRGRWLFAVLMDEACFFLDADYAVNDDEIFKAARPRIIEGGQLLVPSTPWAESGLLYELWKSNHPNNGGAHTIAMALHASTTFLRPDQHTADMVAAERERDADNAAREFDAEPMSGVGGTFFDIEDIRACIVDDMEAILVPQQHQRGWCGLDTGFRKDPSAAVVTRKLGHETVYDVAECHEVIVPRGEKLKPTETIKALIDRARFHKCEQAIADQHYVESVREQADGFVLSEAPRDNVEPYLVTRRLIKERRLRISAKHERLIAQLRQVMSKPTAGGNLQVWSPRKGGQHGDLVSALVLTLWAAESAIVSAPKAATRVNAGMSSSFKRVPRSQRF